MSLSRGRVSWRDGKVNNINNEQLGHAGAVRVVSGYTTEPHYSVVSTETTHERELTAGLNQLAESGGARHLCSRVLKA